VSHAPPTSDEQLWDVGITATLVAAALRAGSLPPKVDVQRDVRVRVRSSGEAIDFSLRTRLLNPSGWRPCWSTATIAREKWLRG